MNDRARKPYHVPVLTRFGEVRTLTQAQTGCSVNDSSMCDTGTAANMGPKP